MDEFSKTERKIIKLLLKENEMSKEKIIKTLKSTDEKTTSSAVSNLYEKKLIDFSWKHYPKKDGGSFHASSSELRIKNKDLCLQILLKHRNSVIMTTITILGVIITAVAAFFSFR